MSRLSGCRARRAARPPSVVAEPPTPTITRVAPASRAVTIELARPRPWTRPPGRCRRRPPTRSSPDARAISITAVRPSSRQAASTGSPSGPVTDGGAVGTAERVEGALAAVGHRHLVAAPTRPRTRRAPTAAATCGRGRGAAELVGCRDRLACTCHRGTVTSRRPAGRSCCVSNRGPVSLRAGRRRRPRRPARRRRPRVGHRTARRRHARPPGSPPRSPTATASPPSEGVVEADGFRVRLLALDPETYRLAYDVVSNEVLWFAHHGLWDLAHEPAFDRIVGAGLGGVPRREPRVRRRGGRGRRPRARWCSCRTTTCASWPSASRAPRPDLRCVHFSHTPFAPPAWLAALPDAAVGELLDGHGRPPRLRVPHRSGGPPTSPRRPRDLAGLDAHHVRVPAGLRSRRHPRRGRQPGVRGGAGRPRGAGRRPLGDRAGRPHRALEEPASAGSSPSTTCSSATPSTAGGSCSWPAPTRRARACPATPPTGPRCTASSTRSTPAAAPTTGRRSCSTWRTTTRARSPCCAGPTCCS